MREPAHCHIVPAITGTSSHRAGCSLSGAGLIVSGSHTITAIGLRIYDGQPRLSCGIAT